MSHVRQDRAFAAAHAVQEATNKSRAVESRRWLAAREQDQQHPEDLGRVRHILAELRGKELTLVVRAHGDRRAGPRTGRVADRRRAS
jgi:hypothetical protein